jgi:hypothetical protein
MKILQSNLWAIPINWTIHKSFCSTIRLPGNGISERPREDRATAFTESKHGYCVSLNPVAQYQDGLQSIGLRIHLSRSFLTSRLPKRSSPLSREPLFNRGLLVYYSWQT